MVDYSFSGLSKLAGFSLFKKKPKDIALKREVEQAKWESYRKGRIAQAKKEGFKKGRHHKTATQRVVGALENIGTGFGGMGGFETDLGRSITEDIFGPSPRRTTTKKHKAKGKGKRTITIRY